MLPVSAEVKTSPLQKASFCSRLFVWWLNPLFKIGHKRKLEPDDMYSVLPEDRSQHLGEELQGYWDQEVKRAQKDAREPSLVKAILKCYWKSYLIWGMFTFLEEGTRVVQPMFLGKMISYVENYHLSDSAALHEAYGYAAGLSASVLVWAVLHHLYFYHMQRVGMRLRVAVCHMIYRKALRLSSSAMGKTTTGQVVNLLSNDVNRFDQNIVAVAQICVVVDTSLSSINSSNMKSKTAALTDKRIRTMSEVITGIRTIKMNAWEKSFIDRITRLRRCLTKEGFQFIFTLSKEISKILKSSYLRGMNLASFFTVSKIMIFVTFITNELLDNRITASQVFVVVTLFEALRFSSTLYFPMAIEKVSEAVVSIQRIKNFLLLDEITQCYPLLPSDGKTILDVQAFTASWEKASETPTLQGLSFTVRPGEVLAVVGPVGAGKSSLLSALLGELPPSQGKVSVHGRIAYVSQQPWVFPGTIKSNILFGKKYEEDRYEEVIRACALEEILSVTYFKYYCEDLGQVLQLLKEGDLTEIGDRGTPLSEGQKARVSLARAVYQDADIYLLDDPLSAVDVGVSRHLFEQCVRQALKEKITILVTHQLQHLEDASHILVLNDGKMVERGTYYEFLKSRVDILPLFEKGKEPSEPSPGPAAPTLVSESLVQSLQSPRPSLKDAAPEDQDTENIQVVLPLEGHLEGKVDFKTYKNYFTAGAHWPVIIFLILANIAAQVAYVLQDWWLAYWANVQSDLYFVGYLKEDEDVVFVLNWCLGVYSGLTVSTVLFGITRSLLIFYILVNSSRALHNKMLESVLRAPVLFFHRNPVGRILNRFSKDVGHMDDLLPLIFLDFIQTFLLMVGVVGVMVAAVPWTAIPVIPLGIISFFLRRYFLETSRDVKRLECTNVICAIFVTVVAFGALILVESLDVGHVGLVLSLSITLTRMSQWCVRQSVEVENMMISVERVIEYTDLVKEASWELEYRPLPSWPKKGLIFFDNVNFSHMLDGPRVLRNMDTGFYPGQKIGIVGRSGAGKSSLTAALFRLSEPEGSIYIDHILTTRIGLHDLRKKMSVALQEPVLFTGTMRENLDPYHEHTDNELWNALEEVQLKESIESLPAKMNTELAESGLNLSVGQKQLVCLARALLRKNQILILDKATSYVDPRTDEFIQKKICERFAQCTVLTISHRLSTIIDSEFMMVLDSGTEKECNWPSILLQHRNCLFYQMLQQLGKKEAARLTKKAKRRTSKGDSQILQ
ncbi:hypothetical protein MJT46_009682 [Ovis ammon polii x Ovis aries]|nr:hypothetical protein MJT46_009682 [Ovis ammon polii x Ovis aries]